MKVFVAGASGAIGRPLIPRLLAAGHEVTGMTRKPERAEEIRAAGAEAVVCDAFDADGLREAVKAAAPEVVVHLLTSLPQKFKPRSDLSPTNRVRVEGTRNLVAAAREAGARRLIAESFAFFYEREGDWVKDEGAPLLAQPPGSFGEVVAALVDLERQVLDAEGIEGLVLRYGLFYGPGTHYGRGGSLAEDTRKRRSPIVGAGTGVFSFIHVDDAAAATVAAVERGDPGVYNVADDDPAPQHKWAPVYSQALGAKPPRRVPVWLARLVAGPAMAQTALSLRGISNAKAKRELGWQPAHPSWRQGFRESLS
jgi:nucleoside-diphosphate-sugar epimerase